MELIEFEDLDLVQDSPQPPEVAVHTQVRIASTVTIDPAEKDRWSELRDYVVEKMEEIHGPFPRDAKQESGIFKSFIGRWGFDNAMAIARCAFEVHGGMWYNSPVRVQRFCKGSDPYFSVQIAGLLGLNQ
jgi:hypothetical protein